ncbi:MAG: hypothetical protein LBO76_00510 [Treponema sp.]|nr:hypothetical protein [Treponema sp.]
MFLCSLSAAAALFVSGSFSPGLPRYAVLAFDEADGGTALALERALGRPALSEFSQWVFLNSFGSLERVPLEGYEGRLEPFDPRRDGYAAKLRDFFNRDGKRWFFIPLDRAMLGPFAALNPERSLAKRVARALEPGRPFSLFLKREGRPPVFRALPWALPWGLSWALPWALPFAAAWPASLVLARAAGPGGRAFPRRGGAQGGSGSAAPRGPGLLVLLAPALFAVSLWGAPGCALLALALYLGALLAPTLREFLVRAIRGGKFTAAPYRFNVAFCLALAPLAALVIWAGRIPPFPGLLACAALFALFLGGLGMQVCRAAPGVLARGAHRQHGEGPGSAAGGPCRFVPLPILPPRRGRPLLPAPFALASCLAFLLNPPPGFWGGPQAPAPWPLLVSEQDYGDHARYQAGFSRRSLRGGAAFADSPYFRYTVGEDGLVEGILPGPPEAAPEIPPFPLADLADFLAGWAVPAAPPWNSGGWIAIIPPFLALGLLALPAGGGKGAAAYGGKRIAA